MRNKDVKSVGGANLWYAVDQDKYAENLDWEYKYIVKYRLPDKYDQKKFYQEIKNVQKHYGYAQPCVQMVQVNIHEWMYFTDYEVEIHFREWGSNREYRNWPVTIQNLEKSIQGFVEAMDAEITGRMLYETPLMFNDVSYTLDLPLQKKIPQQGFTKEKLFAIFTT